MRCKIHTESAPHVQQRCSSSCSVGIEHACVLEARARTSEEDFPVCGLFQTRYEPQQSRLACNQTPARARSASAS